MTSGKPSSIASPNWRLEPAEAESRAPDRLDDPTAVERLEEHLRSGKLRFGESSVDLRQPLLAES